jgi:hypothetical protein
MPVALLPAAVRVPQSLAAGPGQASTMHMAVDEGHAVYEFMQPQGTYAVVIVHTENRNRRLDKTLL